MASVIQRIQQVFRMPCLPVSTTHLRGWEATACSWKAKLNATKTEVMWCASDRCMHQVPAIPLRVGADNVTPISSVWDLGVYLDADSSMTTHISRTAASCFGILRQLRSVQRCLVMLLCRLSPVLCWQSLITVIRCWSAFLQALEPTPGRHQHSSSFGLSWYEGRSHYTCVERPTLAMNPGKDPVQAICHCFQVSTYITLHKIVFRVPKITRTARTLYEIKGVMWEYSYEGKHIEKR